MCLVKYKDRVLEKVIKITISTSIIISTKLSNKLLLLFSSIQKILTFKENSKMWQVFTLFSLIYLFKCLIFDC